MSAKYLPIFSLLFVSCSLFGDEPESTDYANVWDIESRYHEDPETILTEAPNSYIKKTLLFSSGDPLELVLPTLRE